MRLPPKTLPSERDKLFHKPDHKRVGEDVRLDAVHVRPVHAVQVADTDRKIRHRHIEREIVLHRELVMERTEPHDPVRK